MKMTHLHLILQLPFHSKAAHHHHCGVVLTSHHTNTTDGFIEVKRYFEAHVIGRKDDLLQWQKTNGPQFPRAMAIAKKYFAIPGSSVPLKRLFLRLVNQFHKKGAS